MGVLCGELVPFVCRQPEVEAETISSEERRVLAAMQRELSVENQTGEKEG